MIKGVIASVSPQAHIIDLTHTTPPGDVASEAFDLWRSILYFPQRTIFLAVVDPGVGTARRPIAPAWPERICVGPDYGIFTYLLATSEPLTSIVIEARNHQLEEVSNTFHGRDLFATAAAHMARGVNLKQFGPPTDDFIRLSLPHLTLIEDTKVPGEILHADRFGNLITSIGLLQIDGDDILLMPWLPHCSPTRFILAISRIRLSDGKLLPLSSTYGEVPMGEIMAYIGSAGLLEIAINQGRAVDALQSSICKKIKLTSKG